MASKEDIRRWFDSFVVVLQNKGIDLSDPVSLSRIQIRNDIDMEAFRAHNDYTFTDMLYQVDASENVFFPAFMKEGARKSITGFAGYMKWIDQNTVNINKMNTDELDTFAEKLYNMASQNRLYLDAPTNGESYTSAGSYIKVVNGEAFVTEPVDQMIGALNVNGISDNEVKPDRIEENGFTAEEFRQFKTKVMDNLSCTTGRNMNIIQCRDLAVQAKRENPELTDQIENAKKRLDFYQMELFSYRKLMVDQYEQPDIYRNEKAKQKQIRLIDASSRNPNQRTAEDNKLLAENPIFDRVYRSVTINLGKITNKFVSPEHRKDNMSVTEIRNIQAQTPFLFNADGAPIAIGETNQDFLVNIYHNSKLGNEILAIDNSKGSREFVPYSLTLSSNGLFKTMDKKGYAKEMKRITRDFSKVKGPVSGDRELLEQFKQKFQAMPQKMADIRDAVGFDAQHFKEVFNEALELGKQYRESCIGSEELTPATQNILKVINRFEDFAKEAQSEKVFPGQDIRQRIAEKLIDAEAIKLQKKPESRINGVTIQTNRQIRDNLAGLLLNDDKFQKYLEGKSPKDLDKMLRTNGLKELKKFETFTINLVKARRQENPEIAVNQMH